MNDAKLDTKTKMCSHGSNAQESMETYVLLLRGKKMSVESLRALRNTPYPCSSYNDTNKETSALQYCGGRDEIPRYAASK